MSTFLNNLFESDEAEAARLAQAPEGSAMHHWSTLPVTFPVWPEKRLLRLPKTEHDMVVLPYRYSRASDHAAHTPRRHDGWWECIVVASTHPSYPVGGHDLSISTYELRRSTLVEPVFAPVDPTTLTQELS